MIIIKITILCAQDTNNGSAVSMRVDPKGYFVYWRDQNQVSNDILLNFKQMSNARPLHTYCQLGCIECIKCGLLRPMLL